MRSSFMGLVVLSPDSAILEDVDDRLLMLMGGCREVVDRSKKFEVWRGRNSIFESCPGRARLRLAYSTLIRQSSDLIWSNPIKV